ncbi:MAG TPA: GNAT family N-acetyltransferase [Ktedonobacterales bacterium]
MWNELTTDEGWRITVAATNEEAYPILTRDRIMNCFALADLLPPFRQYTRVSLASRAQTGQEAALLIVEHPELNILSPTGHPEGVAALLMSLGLPASPVIHTPVEHWARLASYYDLPASGRDLLRMSLTAQTFQRPSLPPALPAAQRMTKDDLPALLALYDLYPATHLRPALVEEGVFYGIREGTGLVAAGGTHVVALPYGLAVLGYIFTHPDRRGRGHAQAVVSALVTELLARGCQDVILNVEVGNGPAVHVYTKLGFQTHSRWSSAPARRLPRT